MILLSRKTAEKRSIKNKHNMDKRFINEQYSYMYFKINDKIKENIEKGKFSSIVRFNNNMKMEALEKMYNKLKSKGYNIAITTKTLSSGATDYISFYIVFGDSTIIIPHKETIIFNSITE